MDIFNFENINFMELRTMKLHVHPVPFDLLENFNVSNIEQEMSGLGLKRKTL
jgi:hypothetical protein